MLFRLFGMYRLFVRFNANPQVYLTQCFTVVELLLFQFSPTVLLLVTAVCLSICWLSVILKWFYRWTLLTLGSIVSGSPLAAFPYCSYDADRAYRSPFPFTLPSAYASSFSLFMTDSGIGSTLNWSLFTSRPVLSESILTEPARFPRGSITT